MTRPAARPSIRADRPLLTSLLIDTAHQTERHAGYLVASADAFPRFLDDGGAVRLLLNYPPLTELDVLGAFAASAGPANPHDGPFRINEDDSLLYELRATGLVFSISTRRDAANRLELVISSVGRSPR